jgi:hypothetical protein
VNSDSGYYKVRKRESNTGWGKERTTFYQRMERASSCHIRIVYYERAELPDHPQWITHNTVCSRKYDVDLSKLRSDVEVKDVKDTIKFEEELPEDFGPYFLVYAKFATPDTDITPVSQTSEGCQSRRDKEGVFRLDFADRDLAQKAVRALRDAIVQCGGKKVNELYYCTSRRVCAWGAILRCRERKSKKLLGLSAAIRKRA